MQKMVNGKIVPLNPSEGKASGPPHARLPRLQREAPVTRAEFDALATKVAGLATPKVK